MEWANPAPFWARAASGLYGLGAGLYHAAYDRGLRREAWLARPVWSIGNLTAGGTGKTPVVRELAEAALRAGRHPAILTRGYGRRGPGGVLKDGRLEHRKATAEDVGDEPLLLSRWLPEIPIGVGANRRRRAQDVLNGGHPVDLLLLDDGFQHRALGRDADIVLLDAAAPFGNRKLLPAGPLREPPSALARATVILFTGSREGGKVSEAFERELLALAPRAVKRTCWSVPAGIGVLTAGATAPPSLAGRAVHAVAGIARPERFRAALDATGARVEGWSVYRDHHPYSRGDAEREEAEAARAGRLLVTTEKDAVRLEPYLNPQAGWLVLAQRVEVDGGWDALVADLAARTRPPA